ncbi:TetR/AcrR family transcriptional regulator [Amycolatopsis sp. NBRC 101858]|uniref:TetR/AcrR family transcriptional regulator n=1 Tax=Amycolatopsis sp. NBRC 101858 TaxID=3032200 RepID=UPI002556139B|nr:TetR/AcrR family transcriptional regulator [Amycolatopsis sp. NBRC 101858]
MTNHPPAMSRRERLRAQALQDIEDSSFAIIDADGVHALTVAALARSMAMSAPALYRYFPSRDALVAHLIGLSYQQLTATLAHATENSTGTPRSRVRLIVAAYRDWALRYRRRYGMLFAERAADAPPETPHPTPLDQAMALLIDTLGAIRDPVPTSTTSGDHSLDAQLRQWARSQERPDTAPGVGIAAILLWTRVHGIVGLELTGVFDARTIEAQRLIDVEIDNAIRFLNPADPRELHDSP